MELSSLLVAGLLKPKPADGLGSVAEAVIFRDGLDSGYFESAGLFPVVENKPVPAGLSAEGAGAEDPPNRGPFDSSFLSEGAD